MRADERRGRPLLGRERRGELGDGTTTSSAAPSTIDVLAGVQAIAAGDKHTCALTTAGGLRCWGDNGAASSATERQHRIPSADRTCSPGVKAIATGDAHLRRTTTGGVRCWGDNGRGQLGDGTTVDQQPAQPGRPHGRAGDRRGSTTPAR